MLIKIGDRVQTITNTLCNRADLQSYARISNGTILFVNKILSHKLLVASRTSDNERSYILNVSDIKILKYEWEE